MAAIKEFRGLRPKKDLAHRIAELPYDVVSSEEAKEIAKGNQYSFFHISKPEIDLPANVNLYDDGVYEAGKINFSRFIQDGYLLQDEQPKLYLYSQVMQGRQQNGLVACVSIDDYINNNVRKHELTRKDKEQDRTRHIETLSAQAGPVFLFYKEDSFKKVLYEEALRLEPAYDFIASDGIRHILRVIDNTSLIDSFKKAFARDILYIADGHHRAASAATVGLNRRKANPSYTGSEEFNWFLTVIFPHDQLQILAYNKVVKDLYGLTKEAYLKKVAERFSVKKTGIKSPQALHQFSMYLDSEWYTLIPAFNIPDDPIESLDVQILQNMLLDPVLGIKDPRTDKRIDFIGGIRGTQELERLVDSGEYQVAFSMYPTTIEQLIAVADADKIMPPKSTWFEPKLRSGIVVHLLD
jgi:uncharacterized protein (DUF1015 family)